MKKIKEDMKNILKIMALLAVVLCFTSCDDDEKTDNPSLPVTVANLNGTWKLSEWGGKPVADGTYCYITFNRREQTFEMYQNFDSMYTRYITGYFRLEKDPYLGYVISGEYDFGEGSWNNDYIITDLLPAGSMIWTAKDDDADVSKYIRCDKVPDEIVMEAKPKE